jgi:hypothetical protein
LCGEDKLGQSLGCLWRSCRLLAEVDQHKCAEAREFIGATYEWFTEGFNTSYLKSAKEQMEGLA